jgi:hypothetical protein
LLEQEEVMNILEIRITITGILLVLTAISGIIVSALGRPLNTAASTIHKLIAVSSLVLAVVVVYTLQKNVRIGVPVIVLTIVTGLLFRSLFVSGAFLSFDKPANVVLLMVHKAVPLLTVVSAVLLACLQLRTKM